MNADYSFQLGDGIAAMKNMPDSAVDHIITDPPYGTTNLSFDKLRIDWADFMQEALRVVKPKGNIIMFSAQPFTTMLITATPEQFRYHLIWHKTAAVGFLDASARPMRAHEEILLFSSCGRTGGQAEGIVYNPVLTPRARVERKGKVSKGTKIYGSRLYLGQRVYTEGRQPRSVLTFSNSSNKTRIVAGEGKGHPTAKPVDLMRYLVHTYSNAGDAVLDPFSGGGATGVACVQLERRFIGYELNEDYAALAARRLANARDELPSGAVWGAAGSVAPSLPQTPIDAKELYTQTRQRAAKASVSHEKAPLFSDGEENPQ